MRDACNLMKSKQFEILEGLFEEECALFGETIFTTSIFVLTEAEKGYKVFINVITGIKQNYGLDTEEINDWQVGKHGPCVLN